MFVVSFNCDEAGKEVTQAIGGITETQTESFSFPNLETILSGCPLFLSFVRINGNGTGPWDSS